MKTKKSHDLDNNQRPMIITRGDLVRLMRKRMPWIRFYDMMKYVNIIIDILILRALENRITIIDGFGVLYRRKSKPRRIFNNKFKKYQQVITHSVVLRAHKTFIDLLNSDVEFIKELIKENSIKQIKARTNKKRLI